MTKINNYVESALATLGHKVSKRVRTYLLMVDRQPSRSDLAAALAYSEEKAANAFADFLEARGYLGSSNVK